MEVWNKVKGKIAVAGIAFLLGIPAVAGYMGIKPVEGPAGSVCFEAASEAPAVVAE